MCHSVSGVVLRGSGDVRGCQSFIAYCRPLSKRFGSATVNFSTSSLPLCDNPLNHIGNVSSWHKTHHRGFTVDPLHLSKQFHAKEEENAIHPDTRQRLARMKWRRPSPQGSGGQPGNEPHRATDLTISDGRLWAKTPRRDELASSHELPCPLEFILGHWAACLPDYVQRQIPNPLWHHPCASLLPRIRPSLGPPRYAMVGLCPRRWRLHKQWSTRRPWRLVCCLWTAT